ncbi:MAG TPA: hypothetical protein VJB57_19805 [Dehalococcoidia bacterium]|nr:hypothetical protein [Dehalococcoidia bacterium]
MDFFRAVYRELEERPIRAWLSGLVALGLLVVYAERIQIPVVSGILAVSGPLVVVAAPCWLGALCGFTVFRWTERRGQK